MTTSSTKIPIWFWIVAIIMLLWNLSGLASFFYHVFIPEADLAAMPDVERTIMENYPLYAMIAFAIAVFGGVLGCIGLLTKKKWAKSFFLASMLGMLVQIIHDLFMTQMIEAYGNEAYVMPILVLGFGFFLIWLSNYGIKKNWLS